jgi:hypothetical protein
MYIFKGINNLLFMNFEKTNNGDPTNPDVDPKEAEEIKKELDELVKKVSGMSPEELEATTKAVKQRKEELSA